MAKISRLTDEEVVELFSKLDHSGQVADERRRPRAGRGYMGVLDPLSEQDPSGSRTSEAIGRASFTLVLLVIVFILGIQIAYGVIRRLNTANLSQSVSVESVTHAMESGLEWGDGFTQFPEDFQVEEASEKTGAVKVSVLDDTSKNELELLSHSQLQASALATNALVNDKVERVEYNVYALTDKKGNIRPKSFLGVIPGGKYRRAMLTFIWSKEVSEGSGYVDWKLQVIGLTDGMTEKIESQVNSVSSLAASKAIGQQQANEAADEVQRERMLHGSEIFRGGPAEKLPRAE